MSTATVPVQPEGATTPAAARSDGERPAARRRKPRRGIVFGAGGVLGFAWIAGALAALEQARGITAGEADVIVGTSAGSVMAALIGAGVTTEVIINHERGTPQPGDPVLSFDGDGEAGGSHPPLPRPRLGSRGLLMRSAVRPGRIPPLVALSSLAPVGRGSLEGVRDMLDRVVPPGEWTPHPGTMIVAMDYDTGVRVPFGAATAPKVGLSQAVVASCSIPGWFPPCHMIGRRFVDGGVVSSTSADMLAKMRLDEVYVLAPMASFTYDDPASLAERVERGVRRRTTRRLLSEAETIRRAGAEVLLLAPGPEDLAVMGVNLMESRRRAEVLETSLHTSAAALARGGVRFASAG